MLAKETFPVFRLGISGKCFFFFFNEEREKKNNNLTVKMVPTVCVKDVSL